jgi:hypothetical protein
MFLLKNLKMKNYKAKNLLSAITRYNDTFLSIPGQFGSYLGYCIHLNPVFKPLGSLCPGGSALRFAARREGAGKFFLSRCIAP